MQHERQKAGHDDDAISWNIASGAQCGSRAPDESLARKDCLPSAIDTVDLATVKCCLPLCIAMGRSLLAEN
jgi:hypothetical protein